MTAQQPVTDGHQAVWVEIGGQGTLIGCQCGDHPAKRSARMSMQHVWHQGHRRRLSLARVDYCWPVGTYAKAGELNRGGIMAPASPGCSLT